MNFKIYILSTVLFGMAVACSSTDQHGHDEHEHHEDENQNKVVLTERQQQAIGLESGQVEQKNLGEVLELSGRVEIPPQRKATISPIIGGFVREVKVIEGDRVKKGQLLATLEHPDFINLQQAYLEQFNELTFLEKEYGRKKKLYEQQVGAGKEYQRISSDYNSTKVKLSALHAQLEMLGINPKQVEKGALVSKVSIRATIDGIIDQVSINLGSFATAQQSMFEIINLDDLHIHFMVFEKDLGRIQKGDEIRFTTPNKTEGDFVAEVYALSSSFNEETKRSEIHTHLKKGDGHKLYPGMYVVGEVITQTQMCYVLPTEAIVKKDGKSYVFIEEDGTEGEVQEGKGNHHVHGHNHHGHKEGTSYRMSEVVSGITALGYSEVKFLEELSLETKIVKKGAYWLIAELGKAETAHEH